jgi:hypothetical protein
MAATIAKMKAARDGPHKKPGRPPADKDFVPHMDAVGDIDELWQEEFGD